MAIPVEMTAYVKLTDENCHTRPNTREETFWQPGTRVECANPDAPLEPCGPGAIHCYAGETQAEALALAAMMDPAHAGYGDAARAFAFVPEDEVIDGGEKAICRAGAIGEELELPKPTVEQRVEFGIRASLLVPQSHAYRRWAGGWLDGTDQSESAARAAAWTAASAAAAEAEAAAWAEEAAARAAWRRGRGGGGAAAEGVRAADAAAAAARGRQRTAAGCPRVPALSVLEGRAWEFAAQVPRWRAVTEWWRPGWVIRGGCARVITSFRRG